MLGNYLDIMIDSLKKKSGLLDEIEQKSKAQADIIKNSDTLIADLDKNMEEKSALIEQLNSLDDGFEALYENIKDNLEAQKAQYADKIRTIQGLIEEVVGKSASIQAIEARNKADIEAHFAGERKSLREKKTVSKVAYNYYLTANKIDFTTPQFMDKKK